MSNPEEFLLEFKRQLVHLSLGMGIAISSFFLLPQFSNLVVVALILAVLLLYAISRRSSKGTILSTSLLFHFERGEDIENFPFRGAINYGIGIIPAILFLPVDVACGIIAVLSAGDSMSTLIGKFMGRMRFGDKSLEGLLSFVLFGFFAAGIFIPPSMAMSLALVGGLMEFFVFPKGLNDNLTIPVGLTVLYYIWMSV